MNKGPRQAKRSWKNTLRMVLQRLIVLVALGIAIGWCLNRIEGALEKRHEPAGFVRGLVQGALMPITMPNLVFGHDVTIYAANNTGRTYKIGYTLGVNTCGLIFFGFFFWRVRRMKLRMTNNFIGRNDELPVTDDERMTNSECRNRH